MTTNLAEALDLLGVPLFRLEAHAGGAVKGRWRAPRGWQRSTAAGNEAALAALQPGDGLAALGGAGLDILDFDVQHGGRITYNAMNAQGLLPPVRFAVATPSGGVHLYVDGLGLGGSKPGHRADTPEPWPGLDFQAAGAFVLAPPTDGYRWLLNGDWPAGWDRPVAGTAEAFRWAISQRYAQPASIPPSGADREPTDQERAKAQAVLAKACREVEAAAGGRNVTVSRHLLPLYRFVQAHCLDRADVDAQLWAAAQAAPGDHPYTRDEFDASRESAWRKARPELPTVSGAADDFAPARPEPDGLLARFPRVSLAELLDPHQPPREWVVEPLLMAGASVAFVAPAGHMKSLLALGLAVAVASGAPDFAGMPIPRGRRVLVLDMENTPDDLRDRLLSFGVDATTDLDQLVLLSLPALSPLDTERGGAEFLQVLDAYGMQRGDLVVLDSYQRVTEAGENDADTTRGYYRHTGVHLKERGLTVIRTDNTGKDIGRGARGSSGKRDDVDVEYLITADSTGVQVALGKVRQRGIDEMRIRVDRTGGLTTFASDHTPTQQRRLQECVAWLDELNLDANWGLHRAYEWLKTHAAPVPFTRSLVRDALTWRKDRDNAFSAVPDGPAHPSDLGGVPRAVAQGGTAQEETP